MTLCNERPLPTMQRQWTDSNNNNFWKVVEWNRLKMDVLHRPVQVSDKSVKCNNGSQVIVWKPLLLPISSEWLLTGCPLDDLIFILVLRNLRTFHFVSLQNENQSWHQTSLLRSVSIKVKLPPFFPMLHHGCAIQFKADIGLENSSLMVCSGRQYGESRIGKLAYIIHVFCSSFPFFDHFQWLALKYQIRGQSKETQDDFRKHEAIFMLVVGVLWLFQFWKPNWMMTLCLNARFVVVVLLDNKWHFVNRFF